MIYVSRVLLFSFVLLMLGACSPEENGTNKTKAAKENLTPSVLVSDLIKKKFDADKPHAFGVINDELAFLHHDADRIVLRKNGVDSIVADKQKSVGSFWLHVDGNKVYALWWRKFNDKAGKKLFISVSNDSGKTFGVASVLNGGNGVLPTISVASNAENVIVTYHDERNNLFQVFANYSVDGGKTWLENDIRVDQDSLEEMLDNKNKRFVSSVAPDAFIVGNKIVIVWLQINLTGDPAGISLNSRSYDLVDKSWSNTNIFYSNVNLPGVEHKTYQADGKIITFAELKGEGLLAFLSADAGKTWSALGGNYSHLNSSDLGVSFINMAVDNNVAVVATTREEPKKKAIIDYSTISLLEKKWLHKPRQLDRGKNKLTRSNNPMMGAFSDGTIVSAWDDYRNILSTVYVDVRKPGSGEWLENPLPLTAPGLFNMNIRKLLVGDSKAWVISINQKYNGKKLINVLYAHEIKNNKESGVVISNLPPKQKQLSEDELKKRLEKRVKEFWALRKSGDWEGTWGYFDPLYRLKFGKKQWLATQGKLTFGEHEFSEVKIDNQIFGLAKGSIYLGTNIQSAEEGVLEASPLIKKNGETRWGWFYDDWYMMPNLFFMKVHDF